VTRPGGIERTRRRIALSSIGIGVHGTAHRRVRRRLFREREISDVHSAAGTVMRRDASHEDRGHDRPRV
jgi:hypothetical protein